MTDHMIPILAKFGPITAIAVGVVWWLTYSLSGDLHAVKASQERHAMETAFYLRALCVNSAKDDAQRAACIPTRFDLER